MTKTEAHDLKDNEMLLKVTKEQHARIMKAVEWMQRISLKRIEENRIENPSYIYKDDLDQLLFNNYMAWCTLQTELEEATI